MKTTLYAGRHLNLIQDERWEYIERCGKADGVLILAVTDEGKMLLVEEFRVPVHSRVIGLPAGLSGDQGEESFEETARRELEEETGYTAACIDLLVIGPSSPGLTSEMAVLVHASKLTKVGEGGGVDAESILVHEIPVPEVHDWLMSQMREGVLVDPRIFAALYFLLWGNEKSFLGREEAP